jgi:hypothetical protein
MKLIFCTKEGKITEHQGYVDANNEFVFDCNTADCGTFVKFPKVGDAAVLTVLIENYNTVQGEVGAQMAETKQQQAILSEVTADGTKVETPSTTTPEA